MTCFTIENDARLRECLNISQEELARVKAQLEVARSGLEEAQRILTNLQPHISNLLDAKTQAPFIDNHVDAAMEAISAALKASE